MVRTDCRPPQLQIPVINITSKRIITAALTGAIHTSTIPPYLPVIPKQLIEEIHAVYEAGAAVAHLHVRDTQTGVPFNKQEKLPAAANLNYCLFRLVN